MKISVCIAAYNEELYLSKCIESIEEYNGSNDLEIIIVDDFSTDNTANIANTHAKNSEFNIKVLSNETKGKVSAFNTALKNCTGDCILFLGADDLAIASTFDERLLITSMESPAIAFGSMKTVSDWESFNNIRHPRLGGGCKTGGAGWFNRQFLDIYYPIPTTLPNEDTWTEVIYTLFNIRTLSPDIDTMRHRIHPNNSWNRRAGFDEYSKTLEARYLAYDIGTQLPDAINFPGFRKISALNDCEKFRKSGDWFSILIARHVGFRKKIHFILASNAVLYEFKVYVQQIMRYFHK